MLLRLLPAGVFPASSAEHKLYNLHPPHRQSSHLRRRLNPGQVGDHVHLPLHVRGVHHSPKHSRRQVRDTLLPLVTVSISSLTLGKSRQKQTFGS